MSVIVIVKVLLTVVHTLFELVQIRVLDVARLDSLLDILDAHD